MEAQLITYYLCLGLVWGAWLEYFTTTKEIGEPWDFSDRFRNVIFWPVIFAVFLYYFLGGGEE